MPPTEPTPPDLGFELVEEPLPVARPIARAGRPPPGPPPRLGRAVRGMLLLMAAGFAAVFALAAWLNPYTADGAPRGLGTHTQLGLPPCNMVALTGHPCPACGMTTSFSLLMHGDPLAALRTNWVGAGTALYGLLLIPWAVLGAARGRLVGVRGFEPAFTLSVAGFLALSLGRWLWILGRG